MILKIGSLGYFCVHVVSMSHDINSTRTPNVSKRQAKIGSCAQCRGLSNHIKIYEPCILFDLGHGDFTLTCLLSKYTRLTFWDIFVTLLTLFAAYSLNFLMTFFHPTHLLYVLPTIFLVKYLPNNHIGNLLSKCCHFFLYFM